MSAPETSTPPNDERLFLRDVVSKPFDAVTALEFMALWGIASRAVALSENGLSDRQRAAQYILDAGEQQIGSGDDPVGFLIASHAFLADMLNEARRQSETASKQSAIGRTCPENNLPCERACLGGWCQTMFGFPPEDELVPADSRATDK